jgi:hypothetical protein
VWFVDSGHRKGEHPVQRLRKRGYHRPEALHSEAKAAVLIHPEKIKWYGYFWPFKVHRMCVIRLTTHSDLAKDYKRPNFLLVVMLSGAAAPHFISPGFSARRTAIKTVQFSGAPIEESESPEENEQN